MKKEIQHTYKLIILSLLYSIITPSNANEATHNIQLTSTEDQELLNELMTIVDESTVIATQSKMNAKSVPGTVTVLHGKALETLGIATIWEALALVPGFLPTRDSQGGTSVIVRGLNFPFSSGNIKILVNSLSMSRETSGVNSSILQIPIEQVKRIEVIRGPGAVLHGDNAFMGTVNIITYSDGQQLFSRIEGNGAKSGGARGSYNNEPHQLQVHGNVYVFNNDSADSPNGIAAEEERQFGIFSLKYHGLSLTAQSYHRDFQQVNRGLAREGSDIFSAQQKIELTSGLSSQLSFSFLQNDFNLPETKYNGDKIEGSVDFNWTGLKDHQWWFQFTYTDETVNDYKQPVLFQRPSLRPPLRNPLKLSNISRKHYSLSLQDQYELTDALTMTASLRFDHRDDLGKDFFSPRIASVWRITDEHFLKAQYAKGFRVPTFFELHTRLGKSNLKEETIATSELTYIYHNPKYTGKITLFYSQLKDMIFLRPLSNFGNVAEAENMGIEVEWEQQLTDQLQWQANFSYVDSWSTRSLNGSKVEEDDASTHWLSNITVSYHPIEKVILSAHWHYTGGRSTPRINLISENSFNLTASTVDFVTQGLGIKLGVKNLFNENKQDVLTSPTHLRLLDYNDKITVWAQIAYEL